MVLGSVVGYLFYPLTLVSLCSLVHVTTAVHVGRALLHAVTSVGIVHWAALGTLVGIELFACGTVLRWLVRMWRQVWRPATIVSLALLTLYVMASTTVCAHYMYVKYAVNGGVSPEMMHMDMRRAHVLTKYLLNKW